MLQKALTSMLLDSLTIFLLPATKRLLWLAGSVLIYVLATNFSWLLRQLLHRVHWSGCAIYLFGFTRFVYYVGIPYAALLRGGVTLAALGVTPVPTRDRLGQGGLVTAGMLLLIGLVVWHYRRAVSRLALETEVSTSEVVEQLNQPWGWFLVLLRVIYQEVHWAFYRALPVLILDDPYLGSFLGLALVLCEAYANPRIRELLRVAVGAELLLLSACFAVVSTLLFVLTGTSWLGAGIHLLATIGWMLLVRWQKWPAPRQS